MVVSLKVKSGCGLAQRRSRLAWHPALITEPLPFESSQIHEPVPRLSGFIAACHQRFPLSSVILSAVLLPTETANQHIP